MNNKLIIPEHIMLKLRAWRDMGDTEVTGFFITEKDNPLTVVDAILAKAKCSMASVDISAESLQDMYLEQSKNGIYPGQLLIWWHTHPGNSANPSTEDIKTFNELGRDRTTNMMYILAKNDNETMKLSVRDKITDLTSENNLQINHPIISWTNMPDYAELKAEYDEKITEHAPVASHYWKNQAKMNGVQAIDKNFDYLKNQYPSIYNYMDDVIDITDEDAEELFEQLDELVERGIMTEEEADEEALSYGWEFDFYSARKAEEKQTPGGKNDAAA